MRLFAAVLSAAFLAVLSAPAVQADPHLAKFARFAPEAHNKPCVDWCRKHITLGLTKTVWEAPQRFRRVGPINVAIGFGVENPKSIVGISRCHARAYGNGAAIDFRVCNRLVVSGIALAPVTLDMLYRIPPPTGTLDRRY